MLQPVRINSITVTDYAITVDYGDNALNPPLPLRLLRRRLSPHRSNSAASTLPEPVRGGANAGTRRQVLAGEATRHLNRLLRRALRHPGTSPGQAIIAG